MKVHSTIAGGLATLDMLDGLPQEPAFPVEEYQSRLTAVRDGMRGAGYRRAASCSIRRTCCT